MDEKAITDARITGFPVSIERRPGRPVFGRHRAAGPGAGAGAHGWVAVPDTNEMAGFCLAASMFLALGPTLRAGTHVRVTIVLFRLKAGPRRAVEAITLLAATGLGGCFLLTGWRRLPGKVGHTATPRRVFWPFHYGFHRPRWPLACWFSPSRRSRRWLTALAAATPPSSPERRPP